MLKKKTDTCEVWRKRAYELKLTLNSTAVLSEPEDAYLVAQFVHAIRYLRTHTHTHTHGVIVCLRVCLQTL